MTDEIRVTDPNTGGQKGQKLARFSLIPARWLWELAEHYGKGSKKYEDRNWERGYRWSLSLDAHSRHLHQWLNGEAHDPETGSNHLVAAAWHLIALWFFDTYGKGTDDLRHVTAKKQAEEEFSRLFTASESAFSLGSDFTYLNPEPPPHGENCRCYSCLDDNVLL